MSTDDRADGRGQGASDAERGIDGQGEILADSPRPPQCLRCAGPDAVRRVFWWPTSTEGNGPLQTRRQGLACESCVAAVATRGRSMREKMVVVSPPPALLSWLLQNHPSVKVLTERGHGKPLGSSDAWFASFVADANDDDFARISERVTEEIVRRNCEAWGLQGPVSVGKPLSFTARETEAWARPFLMLLSEADDVGLHAITDLVMGEGSRRVHERHREGGRFGWPRPSLFVTTGPTAQKASQKSAYEMRAELLAFIEGAVTFWERECRPRDLRGRLEGLVHSILATLDGCTVGIPRFELACAPHPSEREFLSSRGDAWPPTGVITEGVELHHEWALRRGTFALPETPTDGREPQVPASVPRRS
jgi:hypothetical protein